MNKVVDFLYERESYLIRGACFDVFKEFGGAFKEKIVDRALTKALIKRGLKVEEQKRINPVRNFRGVFGSPRKFSVS